jgi:hypothetical protein
VLNRRHYEKIYETGRQSVTSIYEKNWRGGGGSMKKMGLKRIAPIKKEAIFEKESLFE